MVLELWLGIHFHSGEFHAHTRSIAVTRSPVGKG